MDIVILIGAAAFHINDQYRFGVRLFRILRIGGVCVAVTWEEAVVAQHAQAFGLSLLESALGCDMT